MKYLTYIECTGTQYIDTGWTPSEGDIFTVETSLSSGTSESGFAGYPDQWELYYDGMKVFAWSSNVQITALQIESETVSYNQKNTIQVRFDSTQSTGTAYLGLYRTNKYLFSGRIYSAVVEDSNGTLVRDFVPAENDGTVGLWDKVNEVFYSNAGTGEFVGGEELILTPTLSHTFTHLLNNVLYYGKVFVVNPKGRVNLRCDLASAFATPQGGILLETLPVGSEVKIPVNGVDYNFIVVNQGNPDSALYDSSCDGTWLLMKDVYENRAWSNTNNDYSTSNIHTYLNGDFFNLIDSNVQDIIKDVKIPYVKGAGGSGGIMSGSNGLNTKLFILDCFEVGWTKSTDSNFYTIGACLDYFSGANNSNRIAYYNNTAAGWGLRCSYTAGRYWYVTSTGSYNSNGYSGSTGVRPAFILPSNTECELETNEDGSYNLKLGTPLNNLPEGSIVYINENSTPVPFYLAKHDYESGLNGTGRTLLVRKDCYDSRIIMDTNYGSGGALYTQSPLDAWANSDYKSLFDSTIQEAMATTKFYYSTSRSTTATIGTLERSVFILSLTELGLTYSYCWAEGSTLPIADTLRVAYLNGTVTTQHTRTLGAMWANAFAGVTSSGTVQAVGANTTAGSRPCFTLPSTSMVSANADGTFTLLVGGSTNTPELEDTYLLNTTDKCTDITGGYTISYNYNNMRYSVSHNNGIQVYPNTNGDAGQIAIQTTKLINVTGFKKLLATLSSSGGTILNTSTVKLILCTTNTGNPINSAVKSIDFAWSNLTASAELDLTDVTGEYYVAIYWNYPKTLYDGYINTIQLLG